MGLSKVTVGPWSGWWRATDLSPKASQYVKFTLPKEYRVFSDGAWYIHAKYTAGVKFWIGEPTVPEFEDPYVVMHLLPTASQAIIDAVFRTLAKELHPDAGGDPEAFMRLKTAYDKLKAI